MNTVPQRLAPVRDSQGASTVHWRAATLWFPKVVQPGPPGGHAKSANWCDFARPTQVIVAQGKCLVVRAEEEVVGAVRHEYLVAHIGGSQATGSGIGGSGSTLGVQALDESGLG